METTVCQGDLNAHLLLDNILDYFFLSFLCFQNLSFLMEKINWNTSYRFIRRASLGLLLHLNGNCLLLRFILVIKLNAQYFID